jgi:hypothetical protein
MDLLLTCQMVDSKFSMARKKEEYLFSWPPNVQILFQPDILLCTPRRRNPTEISLFNNWISTDLPNG